MPTPFCSWCPRTSAQEKSRVGAGFLQVSPGRSAYGLCHSPSLGRGWAGVQVTWGTQNLLCPCLSLWSFWTFRLCSAVHCSGTSSPEAPAGAGHLSGSRVVFCLVLSLRGLRHLPGLNRAPWKGFSPAARGSASCLRGSGAGHFAAWK